MPPPPYPIPAETFIATLAQVAASQGDAMAVAVLAESEPELEPYDSWSDWGVEHWNYALHLRLEVGLFGRLGKEREGLSDRLLSLAREITRDDRDAPVTSVTLAPVMRPMDNWRENARAWLRGEGINNQGRVRSDNIAAKLHDGLLFRSGAEMTLYDALKAKGVYVAPLPVLIRGGASYQRLEPDFLLLYRGVAMVVEVDGATVHRESPADAHARTQGLQLNGVKIERVKASDCATPRLAEQCAAQLLSALEHYRQL